MAGKVEIVEPSIEQPVEVPQWGSPARYIGTVCLIILGVAALFLLRPVLQIIFVAFVISIIIYMPARAISYRFNIGYTLVIALIFLTIFIIAVVVLLIVVPALIDQLNLILQIPQDANDQFLAALQNYQPGDAVIAIGSQTIDFHPLVQAIRHAVLSESTSASAVQSTSADNAILSSIMSDIVQTVEATIQMIGSVVGGIASFIGFLFLAFFISFLSLLDLNRNRGFMANVIPPRFHREIVILLNKIDRVWIGFFKGQVIVGGILGLFAYVQYSLMGIPGALPLAILNAFLSLIPNVGGIISAIPTTLVCLIAGSTVFTDMSNILFAFLVLLIQTIFSQFIYIFVSPVIVGKAVELPVVVVILGVGVGFALAGILGAFMVVPVLSTIRLLVGYVLAKIAQREPFPGEEVPKTASQGFISQIYVDS